ncbi:MAG: hypothetical protein ONB16_07635 [candidate division KSB1 bacterium]|nr:hypothetical protein [candidate division KSB1 bacterium]MDZ7319657.1 hypothetical protein [candidate division KSB1 bacterium]MDZ7340095.1 hypothetical protein [candidate division KSB1 bacterium]
MRRYRRGNAVLTPDNRDSYAAVIGRDEVWVEQRRLKLETQWLALEYKLSLAIQQFQNRQLAELMAAAHATDVSPET